MADKDSGWRDNRKQRKSSKRRSADYSDDDRKNSKAKAKAGDFQKNTKTSSDGHSKYSEKEIQLKQRLTEKYRDMNNKKNYKPEGHERTKSRIDRDHSEEYGKRSKHDRSTDERQRKQERSRSPHSSSKREKEKRRDRSPDGFTKNTQYEQNSTTKRDKYSTHSSGDGYCEDMKHKSSKKRDEKYSDIHHSDRNRDEPKSPRNRQHSTKHKSSNWDRKETDSRLPRHDEDRSRSQKSRDSRKQREWDRGKRYGDEENITREFGVPDEEQENKDNLEQKKEEPNFGLSGKLTEYTNTYNGVVIKYNEPSEARKPKTKWRLYPFKGEQALQLLQLHRQSAFLLGRDRHIADIPIDHPSCSSQHAVLQFRLVEYERADGMMGKKVKPYVIDLESTNGTFVNNNKIEPRRYVELMEQDVLKFGFSSREYVMLHEKSKADKDEDENESGDEEDNKKDS